MVTIRHEQLLDAYVKYQLWNSLFGLCFLESAVTGVETALEIVTGDVAIAIGEPIVGAASVARRSDTAEIRKTIAKA